MRHAFRLSSAALARLVPVLVAISVLVFSIVHMIPGDRCRRLEASPATVDAIRRDLGLDSRSPCSTRFVMNALAGDFGVSIRTGAPVGREILDRLPHTAILAAGGVALAVVLGLVVGAAAALSRRVFVDRLLTAASLVAASTPSYWLALMLMLLFSVTLGWLPAIGVGSAAHYLLPCLALGLQSVGAVARMTRASVEILTQDFLRAARAKGVPTGVFSRTACGTRCCPCSVCGSARGRAARRHRARGECARYPAWADDGRRVVARDFPMVQGGVLVVAAMVVLVNGVTDVVAGLSDPRVRLMEIWARFGDTLALAHSRC
jgi:ABC-type dipeptide/oligopeptide/nickel transport system permease component